MLLKKNLSILTLVVFVGILFSVASCSKDSTTDISDDGSSSDTTDSTATTSSVGVGKVVALADSFKETLTTAEQSQVFIDLNLTNAKRWSNLPCALSCRNGILFSSLTTAQQEAALALIKASAGSVEGEGYDEFQTIRAADDYLDENHDNDGSYSEGNYVIAILGTPSTTGKWMLQFGGHHYASNITYNSDTVVSITPLHEGVEPSTAFTVNDTTYSCPLTDELAVMQDMLGSFTSSELASAKISGTFSDCLMVPGSTTNTMPSTKQGIQYSSLSTSAQTEVWNAIQPWINDVDSLQSAAIREVYETELDDTYICYASNSNATVGSPTSFFTTNTDYVRIDGPSIWIEFICQTGVVFSDEIHYHSVMRDHERDYIGLE